MHVDMYSYYSYHEILIYQLLKLWLYHAVPVESEADGIVGSTAESIAVNNFSHVALESASNHLFHKSLQQLLVSPGLSLFITFRSPISISKYIPISSQ